MRLSLSSRFRIMWRHRKIGRPSVHDLRVEFDEIIAANYDVLPIVPGTTLDDQLGGGLR